jgi:hypothetical protein
MNVNPASNPTDLSEAIPVSRFWHAAQQGYSLDPEIATRKFGPRHAVLKTPLDNIRITTFIANESEVKIVDPTRISSVEGHGCAVKFIAPTE